MNGVVTDAAGAVIPGATVTLTNKSIGTSYTQMTNRQGVYTFPTVPPGAGYTATFTHVGFAAVKVADITLGVGITRTQDEKLVAGSTQVVEVSASNTEVTLNTTDATIGSNIDVNQLHDLPIYDRTAGITTLFNLEPGVVNTQLDTAGSTQSGSVTGARNDQSSVTVDGLDVNDIAAGTIFGIIGNAPVDSVEQFTGTVGGLNSNLGTGSGGQFQLVTKHGTNQFHGNVNEYHRDTTTTSNSYFNKTAVTLPRTPLIRNQFGGNVGGPIVKDRLFFFFNFGDSRIIQSSSYAPTVPIATYAPSAQGGPAVINYINNSEGCGNTSRLNNAANCISALPATGTAGPTGQSVQSLDPGGQGFDDSLLAFFAVRYPRPNDVTLGDGVNTEGLRFNAPTPTIDTTYVGRIDYNATKSEKLYGRFTLNRQNQVRTGPEFLGDPNSLLEVDRSYGYVVSLISTLGNNKVNQLYYGDNISKLNFPNGDFPTTPNNFSFSGLANPYGTYNSQNRRIPIPVVRDDYNWQVKSNSLVLGGLFKFIKTNSNNVTNYNFVDGGLQGTALAQGLPSTVRPSDINSAANALNDYDRLYATGIGVIGEISTNFDYAANETLNANGVGNPNAYRYFETEAYFGDTWRVNKQLTLNFGLRWQTDSVPYEVNGKESIYNLVGLGHSQSTFAQYFNQRLAQNATGSLDQPLPFFDAVLGGKANNAPGFYGQTYKDYQPRFAFSYNPSFAPKTVLNGSASLVYDRTVINAVNNLQGQLSFLFENNVTNQFGSLTDLTQRFTPTQGLAVASPLLPVGVPPASGFVPFVGPGGPFGLAAGQEGFDIDPGLKDPYSININAGIQQQLPFHMVLRVNYDGRLGRRLLADADASQVLNFPDNVSGQNLSQAFANLATQLRSGTAANNLTAIPWFENVVTPGIGQKFGFANNTQLVEADVLGQLGVRDDIGDSIQSLAADGLIPANVAVASQFGTNAFLTNKGSSNYHALLLSLSKNLSQGFRFDFNYTLAHSIDNNSQAANNNALFNVTGILCDVTQPRACRGNSDFDVRQIITADFQYDLPFGHNQRFFGNSGTLVNEVIGGWSVSGIPSHRTGLPINVLSDAFNASFAAEDPAVFTGSKSNLNSLKAHVNNVQGTVYNFAGGAAGATRAFNLFRGPLGLEYGSRNLLHGPSATNLDLGLGKAFPIIPSRHINLNFRADAFNIFNHPNFSNPGGSTPDIVNNASPFGQIASTISPSGQVNDIRVAQFSLRLEF
jgi:hypothetical protein